MPTGMALRDPGMRKIWPFGFNFLLFAGYASVGPFFVLYYQGLGFTGTQIGLLSGISPLITLVCAPLWTRVADKTARHRLVMVLALLTGVGAFSAFPLFRTFLPILGLSALLNVFLAPVAPLADSAAMFMLADRKDMYGRIRLGGTIGYGVAASIAGVVVHRFGIASAFWSCASLFLIAALVSRKLTYDTSAAAEHAQQGVRKLLANPHWPLFLAVSFAGGLALASFNYFFPYMKELGASASTMGLALTIGTISEIPVLFF
ncbi:MFS transporter, partial [Candidatus Bipolaricaulota bacterium]|nr:MFS transporter [Candidatus Bipolaricaulota bacterium]